MGAEFDELVRGEDTHVERERDSMETFAISLLVGSASLVITLALRRPDCLGARFLQCWTEWSPPEFPYMFWGSVVAGVFGVFLLWTMRRRGSGLSDRALVWGAASVIALSVGVAVQIPSMLPNDILVFFKAFMVIVTATAAVVSARAWWDIRRGQPEPNPPVASAVLAGIPSVTVTRLPPSPPMLWVARLLWVAPLGLLLSLVIEIAENNRRIALTQPMDDMSFLMYVLMFGALLIVSAIALTLSFAAYRVVRGRSAVARGMVLGLALITFALCGAVGWGVITTRERVYGLLPLGGIPALAIALAGIGAIVWYVVGGLAGRGHQARTGAASL